MTVGLPPRRTSSPSASAVREGQGIHRAEIAEEEGRLPHCDVRPRMMGQDDDRRVERRLVSPPPRPGLVLPGTLLRAELAAAHDLRTDALPGGGGEGVVDAVAAAADGLGLVPRRSDEGVRREEP
jgi:hypothetical protein